MRPTDDTLAAVNAWLSENGIKSHVISPAGDWIEFTAPVSQAADLFNADFSVFQHTGGSQSIRTLEYSLPIDLNNHVEFLFPGVSSVQLLLCALYAETL